MGRVIAAQDGSGYAVRNPAAAGDDYSLAMLEWSCCEGTPEETTYRTMTYYGPAVNEPAPIPPATGGRWQSPWTYIVWQESPTERIALQFRWAFDFENPGTSEIELDAVLSAGNPYAFTGWSVFVAAQTPALVPTGWTVTADVDGTGALPVVTTSFTLAPTGAFTAQFDAAALDTALGGLVPWGPLGTWPAVAAMGLEWDSPDEWNGSDDRVDYLEAACSDETPTRYEPIVPVVFP